MLGPIFVTHVKNWDHHLATMVDFWSSALRGTARFKGAPLAKHAALPGLHIEMFHQWLSLFRQTTQSLGNAALQARADELAHRIAGSLWYGYLQRHDPERQVAHIAVVRNHEVGAMRPRSSDSAMDGRHDQVEL